MDKHTRGRFLLKIVLILNVSFLVYNLSALVLHLLPTPRESQNGFQHSSDYYIKYRDISNQILQSGYTRPNISAGFLVPNIVHYIWYTEKPISFKFHHMVAVYSAHKIIRPRVIFFHTNMPPIGKYWEMVKKLDNFVVNIRQPPVQLFGEDVKAPRFYTSHSNVDRVKILTEVGGIYLDLDVIVTRPFDDLRRYPCVIGREQIDQACGSVIVCSKHSPFLLLWINSFLDDYRIDVWAYNSGKVPFNLAVRFPHLVYLDEDRLNRPNFDELDLLWGPKRFNWTRNYAVHTWYRLWKDQSSFYSGVEPDEVNIKSWNSSFGEMVRSILYGSRRLMDVD